MALAYEFLGRQMMSADVVYPPVFPVLLGVLVVVVGPLPGLAWSALISHTLLVVAVYWVSRSLGRLHALAAALLILFAGYQLEAFAWGSYPQLLATGVAVFAVHSAVRYVKTGGALALGPAALMALLVLATHELISGLLVLAAPLAVFHTRWMDHQSLSTERRRAWIVVAGAFTIGALQLILGIAEAQTGVEPVLNPLNHRLAASLWLTAREAVVPWLTVGLVSVAALCYRAWPVRSRPIVSVGVAITLSGVIGFVMLFEQRVLLWAQLGVVMLAVATIARWRQRLEERQQHRLSTLLLIVSLAVFGSIAVTGVQNFIEASAWYQVVDAESLESLEALRAASEPEDLVIASSGHNGNPVGWWVEGYAQRPAYSAMDIRYAAFPEERRQASLSNLILSGRLTESETRGLLQEIGARFVVVDKRGPDAHWVAEAGRMGLQVVDESNSLVIFEVVE